MAEEQQREAARVLLGLSAEADAETAIEAAVRFASAVHSELMCLLVEQDDLISLAGLPFARSFGIGGMTSEITVEAVRTQFERSARMLTASLTRVCAQAKVQWQLQRPQGDVLREISVTLRPGDIVVLDTEVFMRGQPEGLAILQELLQRAAAVVLPPRVPSALERIVVLSDIEKPGFAAELARNYATMHGQTPEPIDIQSFLAGSAQASTVVLPSGLLGAMGGTEFLREARRKRMTVVLTAD